MTALATFRGRLIVAIGVALAITGCAQHLESVVVVQDRSKVDLVSFQCQNDTRSGFITRVCYDSGSRRMLLGFQGGTYKQYCRVDVSIADGLLSAPSMGKFYATKIRGRFGCGAHRRLSS
jgi:hypothetical protein